jgi:outer membrane protein
MLGYKGMSEPQGGAMKLAYIDSNVIIAQTPGSEEAQATFDREMARWQTEVQALADSLQLMMTAYEQQQIMLSPEAKQERQQEILQKRMEYEQRVADLEQVAARRRQELIQPIFDKITATLAQIRDEGDYTMIFDAAAGALIAADTTLNITGVVIERLTQQGTTPGNTQNQ